MAEIDLQQGNCLDLMKQIPDGGVDFVLCDLPYGITANKWDVVLPFDKLWEQYNRIIKDHGCIALFGREPFSSELRLSNKKMYRYDWIWKKTLPGRYVQSHKMPMAAFENISIFYKHLPTYNPQMREGKSYVRNDPNLKYKTDRNMHVKALPYERKYTGRFPIDVIEFSNGNHHVLHPTQKPIDLLEYLIKTYTNEDMTVLDNCMGSGSTGVACVNTNRNFIGYELQPEYFEIAQKRINNAKEKRKIS